jgi:phosphatidylglycerophosphate synthase
MANWISFIRTLLALAAALSLFINSAAIYWAAFAATVMAIWMDGLDGYVARKFNESCESGAVIDILADRAVEQLYWVVFLALGWVPLTMVLPVILRGVLVDGLRAMALKEGYTPFGQTTMMQHPLSVLLVSSRFSRWTYAVCKALAFSLLIVAHVPGLSAAWAAPLLDAGLTTAWIAVAFCLIRGLPVLIEGRRFLTVSAGH